MRGRGAVRRGGARGGFTALFHHRHVVTDSAAPDGAKHGVVARHVAGDAANHRAGDAARVRGWRRGHECSGERKAGEEFRIPHGSNPVLAKPAKLSLNICSTNLANF
jgi:hypothetical protein